MTLQVPNVPHNSYNSQGKRDAQKSITEKHSSSTKLSLYA